jgi:hypothetical protein
MVKKVILDISPSFLSLIVPNHDTNVRNPNQRTIAGLVTIEVKNISDESVTESIYNRYLFLGFSSKSLSS